MPMKWKKPDPLLVERFTEALPDHPAAERKKMFGYPACFVRGHFFAGLHKDGFVIRVPEALKDNLPALRTAVVFDPRETGKGMKDWWVIPALTARDGRKLAALLADAFAEIVKLPPKEKRVAKKARGTGRTGSSTRVAG